MFCERNRLCQPLAWGGVDPSPDLRHSVDVFDDGVGLALLTSGAGVSFEKGKEICGGNRGFSCQSEDGRQSMCQ